MSLYQSTYLFAAILLAVGLPFAVAAEFMKKHAFAFLRSTKAAVIVFGGRGFGFSTYYRNWAKLTSEISREF